MYRIAITFFFNRCETWVTERQINLLGKDRETYVVLFSKSSTTSLSSSVGTNSKNQDPSLENMIQELA